MKVTNFLWLAFCMSQSLIAQQGVVSSGGDILSTNGSVAYSIGQIAYASVSGETGIVNPGVQQPFQFDLVGINDFHRDYFINLYPNPANQFLFLQLSTDEGIIQAQDFFARVYDVKGNLLITQMLRHDVTTILISELPEALYFVQVWQANTFIHSISFSKTN
ncbi:MAG: T9SS type A sorting domain-containing protein [Saprospiraceae bacterium]